MGNGRLTFSWHYMTLRILGFFSSPFSRNIYHPWLLSSPNLTGSSCQASFLPLSFSQVPSLSPWTIGKSCWITRQNPRQRCSRRTTTAHIGTINCYIPKTFGPQKDEKWNFPNVWVFPPGNEGSGLRMAKNIGMQNLVLEFTNLDYIQIEDCPRKTKQQNQNTTNMAIDFT